ncbi:MAG: Ig-like domain-containing protein [Bacteroidota bacterium]|nr:Ig-like domain-containing protein [Bacteroidota bacterium]
MKYFIIFVLPFLLIACAGQRLPEGGPADSEPPVIISVSPKPNSINFSGGSVSIEFSEYVDRRSVEGAIFISPSIENVEYDWSGTELTILFNQELRKNTTYVVSVGTDVVDVRAGNRMAKAFSISFSTGDKIDNGLITGKVYDEKPDGVLIYSYRLNDINPDTLNPAISKPDYLTQAGATGNFELINLAAGKYRLFAVRDEYRNLIYDPETDAAGTTDDVVITTIDTLKSGIKFIIAKEDTTPPRILSAQSTDNRHVFVQFSEPLDSSSVSIKSFQILDTAGQKSLSVLNYFPKGYQFNTFTVLTEKQKADSLYLLKVDGVKDKAGFVITPIAQTKQFTGSTVNDTIPPSIVFSTIKDSTSPIFPHNELVFEFSDMLQLPIRDSTVSLLRKKDSSQVPIQLKVLNPAAFSVKSKTKFLVNERYLLRLHWNQLKDPFSNFRKDSVSSFSFTISDPENLGSIEGAFTGFIGRFPIIEAQNVTDKKQPVVRTKTSEIGKFSFTQLPEGRYTLKAFDDVNKNLINDAGKVFPFVRAEQFFNYADTIRVRPRWPVDGVLFEAR